LKRNKNRSDIFSFETENRRHDFRVRPSDTRPVVIKLGQEEIRIINISAHGLAFKKPGLKEGESHRMVLSLPDRDSTITAILEIVEIDGEGVCHCRYKEVDGDEIEQVHQYVLARQKEVMRSQKKGSHKKRFEAATERLEFF